MRLTLPICLALALSLPAQSQLFADPQEATLRPGESTCITVLTTPSTPGVLVQPQFDAALVQVTPAGATATGSNGRADFQVTCLMPKPAGTTVAFVDPSAAFSSADITVTCAFDKLTLRGSGGSYPGRLSLELAASPAVVPGVFGAILLSTGPGTIPLSLFSATDPRSLSLSPIGLLIPPGFAGLFDLSTFETFAAPALRVPDLGGHAVLYAQGMSLNLGSPPQRLSQPQPVYFSAAGSFWDRGATISLPRSFFPIIETADQKPMVVGGGQGPIFAQIATSAVDVYDPVTDTWSANPTELNTQRGLHTATRLQNGKWLIVGGVDVNNDPQSSAEIYDPTTNTFRMVGSMAEARVGHAATLLPSGEVLISGGLSVMSQVVTTTVNSALDTTEIFALDASGCDGGFRRGPTMQQNRAGHAALPLADGRIYMIGGVGSLFGFLPTIWTATEFFNGSRFDSGPSMATPRAIFSLVQIDSNPDRYLAAGGLSDLLGLGAPTDKAEIYTAAAGQNGTWGPSSPTQEMSAPRGIQSAYRFGDQVVQIGGLQGDLVTPIAINTTEIYTISTRTWSQGPMLSAPRGAYGSYMDPYGVVHIIGGASGVGPNPPASDSTDWYFH